MFLYYNFASNPHRTTQCISLASRATPPSALLNRKSLSVAHSNVFVPAVAAQWDFINLRCLTWRNHQFGIAPVRCQSPRPIFAFKALHSSHDGIDLDVCWRVAQFGEKALDLFGNNPASSSFSSLARLWKKVSSQPRMLHLVHLQACET